MHTRGGYLILVILLLTFKADDALPQQQQQQQHQLQQQQQQQLQRNNNDIKRVDNDYGPVLHISSGVLQLLPDDRTQLLLLTVHESSIRGSSSGSSDSSGSSSNPANSLPWPHLFGPEQLMPMSNPSIHVPRIKVSDNLDFQQRNPNNVKSHGR